MLVVMNRLLRKMTAMRSISSPSPRVDAPCRF